MARTLITEQEFESQFTLAAGFGDSSPIRFNSKIFDFYIEIQPELRELIFIDCEFLEPILFCKGVQLVQEVEVNNEEPDLFNEAETNVFSASITFRECDFEKQIQFDDITFNNKFKMHNCSVNDASFRNTTFNDLADFWLTTFNKDIIFYKTDFNKTTVFSMATFIGNVLFTYSLFDTKVIFARTKFNKGIDLSQSIISGKLQPFDLQFNFKEFKAEYVGKDDETFQNYVDRDAIIPLVNKVHTFQVFKKAFEDIGNYSDSILMQREEKRALKELVKLKLKDEDSSVNNGDKWILNLNRISNHYQSDFRNGIWFTLCMTIVFGFLTLVFTEEFQRHFCWGCEFNKDYFIKGVKFLFNFLNPTRRITYLDSFDLRFYGIAYLFDFFGRMAVGYGIYQTIQAFRKFK
ncbi:MULTISPECIES: pentapeptide repeat-containing protein [Flavobacteriaceae]|uniref:pentapeptide repeat-containing protein n=1 Tax=Flavobacteriaceae TaxID=49546 RepID=UPI0026E35FC1|nr:MULTISPECIES: pentapeptide repeat-containing protein [Flavobacteriaceae]MDO6600645.1 pentapeptide repeat-containing protein [Tenacibaculum sp. 1_MG-2023]MDO7138284.1 pentapeptide repeat-containing protein [Algibacter lectus]